MKFIDLKRCFVPIDNDQEPNLEIGLLWGKQVAGWLEWPELLKHSRVVLLAEASSGKTEEFRNQVRSLTAGGKAAFFVRIENLADDGFEAALDPNDSRNFERWSSRDTEQAWFFLDSIDEARLNHKSLEKALRRFARELQAGLERSHVYISCRVSDWNGDEDIATIERLLPVWEKPAPPAAEGEDAALLDPIFAKRAEPSRSPVEDSSKLKTNELLVAQLVPLNKEQRGILASAGGIDAPNEFIKAIEQNGLDGLADRPGDLLDLAAYWRANKRFDSLKVMTKNGIANKLKERYRYRPDDRELSPEKAHKGVERVAAALTLAKTFTLRTPGYSSAPGHTTGALDPDEILVDWTQPERNALVRRGIFAPSTYGRVRFHHRATQEFLTAEWIDYLIRTGCPKSEVWDLLFARRYGVDTMVPSMHASAAWLAYNHVDICDEIIRREPLVLIRDGDSRSLSLEVKERLLLVYAKRHAAGEISNDSLDRRALWMFASPDLAKVIRQVWTINQRRGFRLDLLRLVREGSIDACIDLARGIAIDNKADGYLRVVALEAIDACGDTRGLSEAAQLLKDNSSESNSRISPSFAAILFPVYLSVDELLDLIQGSKPTKSFSVGDYGQVLDELWRACPDGNSRNRLISGIADLCLAPPFVAEHLLISARHQGLTDHLGPIARDAMQKLGNASPPEGLVRLLMVLERSDRYGSAVQDEPRLGKLVQENEHLQRRLFWADVEEARQNRGPSRNEPSRHWDLDVNGQTLWSLGSRDLNWLFQDLTKNQLVADKRIALSAIIEILGKDDKLNTEAPRLRGLVKGIHDLEQDLISYLTPPSDEYLEQRLRREQRHIQHAREHDEKERKNKASWLRFRAELKTNPSLLSDADNIKDWKSGAYRIYHLNNWLRNKTGKGYTEASLQWRLLAEGFAKSVAKAFCDGMKILWRVTPLERPKRNKNRDAFSVKYTATLAFSGIGLEAAENPDWAKHLSTAEAECAARHACLSHEDYPNWIDALLNAHPATTYPILRKRLREEWFGRQPGHPYYLSHFGSKDKPINQATQELLFELVTGNAPKTLDVLSRGVQILSRLNLNENQHRKVATLARRRLRAAKAADKNNHIQHYLQMLFVVDPEGAVGELGEWLDHADPTSLPQIAERTLSFLFDRNSALTIKSLKNASVTTLQSLVRLTYRHVRPEDDRAHEGTYTPDTRDNAEQARNTVLTALLDRPGTEAYSAVLALSDDDAFESRKFRFKEFARGKAEIDAELPPWTPAEIVAFERNHIAPAKTGDALLAIVMGVLSDVQLSFHHSDATSRTLLERAESEEEVQKWLAEQLDLRSQGRFHVHRESEVAGGDKPDIIVSSTTSQMEVAIEVKHGGMSSWTVRKLKQALTKQLTGSYLKPETRRHGILVISYHGQKKWRDRDTRKTLCFHDVIQQLQLFSESVTTNSRGRIEVCTFGIDASPLP